METLTPLPIAQRHLAEVLTYLTPAFDGDAESVHQSRVATRRLREVLPLTALPELERLTANVRALGRQLGRVRELDVVNSLLSSMSERVPATAAIELHKLRDIVRLRLAKARRRMVKEIEDLDVWALPEAIAPNRASLVSQWVPRAAYVRTPKWVDRIWAAIRERADEAENAAGRAPGVYLPNRTHQARVAVKKLRYAIEIAEETGVWRPRNVLKDLRKIQGTLGDLHDVQVVIDLVDESAVSNPPTPATSVIRALLESDLNRHLSDYARRRDRIFHIADACKRAAARAKPKIPRPLVAAATILSAPLLLDFVRSTPSLGAEPQKRLRDPHVTQKLPATT